jgi:uncharacterized protein (DUF4415 family)
MKNISSEKWVRKTAAEVLKNTNLARLRRAARRPVDTSDIPEVRFTGTGESHRIPKRSITLRLDTHVIEFFRSQGRGYQTRINRVLREAISPPRNVREQLERTAHLLERLAAQIKNEPNIRF